MNEAVPTDQSTSNQVHEVAGTVVQAGHIGSMTVHYTSGPIIDSGGPPPRRGGPGRVTVVVAIAGVVAVVATLVVVANGTFGPLNPGAATSSSPPPPSSGSPESSSLAPTKTSATSVAPVPPAPLPGPLTATAPPPAAPSGPSPFALKPTGVLAFRDEFVKVDQVKDTRAKVARLSCADGGPTALEETYELGGAYRALTSRISVDDEPANAGPITFTVFADGVRVASEPVPVARTLDIQADLTGAERLTLRVSAATCVTVDTAWVEPMLVAP